MRKKIAVVGYGFISGKGHVPAFLKRSDVEVVAVADICPARRELAQKDLPNARVYATYQELLEKEKDLDVVDIATPPYVHAEIAVAAREKRLPRALREAARAHHRAGARDVESGRAEQESFIPLPQL